MSNEVVQIVVDAGLIEAGTLVELQRWGAPVPDPIPITVDPVLIPSLIENAMQREEYIKIRETDLEILHQYLKTQAPGRFFVGSMDGGEAVSVDVVFGKTLLGEYIIPWQTGGQFVDIVTTQGSYLSTPEGDIRFKDARDLYYGYSAAFAICIPE